jgi:hypothetical protein
MTNPWTLSLAVAAVVALFSPSIRRWWTRRRIKSIVLGVNDDLLHIPHGELQHALKESLNHFFPRILEFMLDCDLPKDLGARTRDRYHAAAGITMAFFWSVVSTETVYLKRKLRLTDEVFDDVVNVVMETRHFPVVTPFEVMSSVGEDFKGFLRTMETPDRAEKFCKLADLLFAPATPAGFPGCTQTDFMVAPYIKDGDDPLLS